MGLELRNYLPCGWRLSPTSSGLRLLAPSQESAEQFLEVAIAELIQSANRLSSPIEIAWKDCKLPLRISPKMAVSGHDPKSMKKKVESAIAKPLFSAKTRSRVDLDWNDIHRGQNPIYISQFRDQQNLYLNEAARMAQSEKPPAEFLSATAHALNFEDELLTRCNHLQRDSQLIEYSYHALRWFRDSDSGLWIRKRMQFVSNFYRVTYLGQDCWLGEVLKADPLERFVDNQ